MILFSKMFNKIFISLFLIAFLGASLIFLNSDVVQGKNKNMTHEKRQARDTGNVNSNSNGGYCGTSGNGDNCGNSISTSGNGLSTGGNTGSGNGSSVTSGQVSTTGGTRGGGQVTCNNNSPFISQVLKEFCENLISYWEWPDNLDDSLSSPFNSAQWPLDEVAGDSWGQNKTCSYGLFNFTRAIVHESAGTFGPDVGMLYNEVVSTKDELSVSLWVYPTMKTTDWQMIIGNRFENSSIDRSSGAGFVQGWNFYISTTEKYQINNKPYSKIGIPMGQWSFWWSSLLDSKQGWNKLWLGPAIANEWVHWMITINSITGEVTVYKNGIVASLETTANNDDGRGVFNLDGFNTNPAVDAPFPNYGGDLAKYSVGGSSNPDFFPFDAFFTGRISKFRTYDIVLNQSSVLELMSECELE